MASAGPLRAAASSLFDPAPARSPLPRRAPLASPAASLSPAALSCRLQTRKRQASSSLSRSSSARGRRESPPRSARSPSWSPATPSAASATAPSPRMASRAAGWGECCQPRSEPGGGLRWVSVPHCCQPRTVTHRVFSRLLVGLNLSSPSAEWQRFVHCLFWGLCISPSSERDTCCFRAQNLAALRDTCAALQIRNPRGRQKWIWIQLCDLTRSRGINGTPVFQSGKRETWTGCYRYFIAYILLQGGIFGLGQTHSYSLYPK